MIQLIIPKLKFQDDLDFLYSMADSVSPSKRPEFIYIMSHKEYESQSDDIIINQLRYRHLLITNGPTPTYGFDKTGLRKLAPLNKIITIHGLLSSSIFLKSAANNTLSQDHSIELMEDDSPNRRHVSRMLKDFLTAARDENGKSLNGLDFPIPFEYLQDIPFASDKVAWRQVHRKPFCNNECPTSSIRWALCATSGAYHKSHCDCHGHGTYITPQSGIKIWFVAVPKRKPSGTPLDLRLFDDFGNINLFMDDYSLDQSNAELWDWEVVVLKPGMTL
jgi:hypothetical protein